MSKTPEVVNVVGCGSLAGECDLRALEADLSFGTVKHKAEQGGLEARTDGALIIAWASGSYTVRGVDTVDKCYRVNEQWLDAINSLDVGLVGPSQAFDIKNVVVVGDFHQQINLVAANIGLGLESSEYEPELFPGLVWRSDDATLILFSSGKVVSVGTACVPDAENSIQDLRQELDALGVVETEGSA